MGKQQNIYKKRDGLWEGRYSIGGGVRKSVYGKTQKEVGEKLRQVQADLCKGEYVSTNKLTVAQWLLTWCSEYTPNIKTSTRCEYEKIINTRLIPALGKIKLQSLRPDTVQTYTNDLSKGKYTKEPLSPRSVEFTLMVLKMALKQAQKLSYVKNNVAADVKLPRKEKQEMSILQDVPKFLEIIKTHKHEHLFTVLLFTGCRVGEALGLSWSDVDFRGGSITLRKQISPARTRGAKASRTSLKNDKIRKITPPETVIEAFKERRSIQAQERLQAGQAWQDEHDLVFTDAIGSHLRGDSISRSFKNMLTENGLPQIRLHDLRHSAATLLLQNGVSILQVQRQLGHFSSSFTMDCYGHVNEDMERESASRMQSYIDSIKSVGVVLSVVQPVVQTPILEENMA